MIPPRVALGVNRIVTTFVDVGASMTVSGTGFWLESKPEGKRLFITNRHNVDPRLRPEFIHWRTARVAIELRTDPDDPSVEVREFEVLDLDQALFVSAESDCAVIAEPTLD